MRNVKTTRDSIAGAINKQLPPTLDPLAHDMHTNTSKEACAAADVARLRAATHAMPRNIFGPATRIAHSPRNQPIREHQDCAVHKMDVKPRVPGEILVVESFDFALACSPLAHEYLMLCIYHSVARMGVFWFVATIYNGNQIYIRVDG